MAKKRGVSRFLQSEVERVSRVAKKMGADLEVNPVSGTIRLMFKDGEQKEPEDQDRKRWDKLTERELRGK
jgi:hypothetical protein